MTRQVRADGIGHCIARPAGGQGTPLRDPLAGRQIAIVQNRRARADDIDPAWLSIAKPTHFKAWAAWDPPGAAHLHKIADAIEARAEEIACVEMHGHRPALTFMAKAALRGRRISASSPTARPARATAATCRATEQVNITTRVPIGPVGIITPWNTPFMLSTWKIAPALAAGCTVVHKPAELSPADGPPAGRDRRGERGLPEASWNLVNGLGEDAGKALTEHPDIKAIGFVGESAHRLDDHEQGVGTLKRVHFELGGKNPVIVFADADLERALDAAVFMIYSLNGERCTSSSRLLVQETDLRASSPPRSRRSAKRIKVGHPLDPATEIGPLIHPSGIDQGLLDYFDIARAGRRHASPRRRPPDGRRRHYVKPTLFTGATSGMRIAQEEIFGPVLTAIPFKDEAEALAHRQRPCATA